VTFVSYHAFPAETAPTDFAWFPGSIQENLMVGDRPIDLNWRATM